MNTYFARNEEVQFLELAQKYNVNYVLIDNKYERFYMLMADRSRVKYFHFLTIYILRTILKRIWGMNTSRMK